MEIAHPQTKVLRVIGKLVLLGLLVVLLAKVFLAVIVLAVVGLLTLIIGRALYNRRTFFKRVLLWTKDRLIYSVTTVFQAGTIARLAARSASCMVSALAATLKTFIVVACKLLGYAAKIGCVMVWKPVRKLARVMLSAFAAFFCALKRSAAAMVQVTGGALAKTRSQSGVIFGTFVEASSGALIGAMIGFVPTFLPHEQSLEARVWGAALFGAFLGITVGLSRTAWAKQGEQSHFFENQN